MKTYHFCVIARRAQFFAPDAAIFNGTKQHPGTKFGETARSGMRPTCTPSPCTSCLVFPYKTAGRSKQIRLLLPFCLRMACPPNLLARRRFNDPAYCIALFHTVPLRVLPIVYRLGRKKYPSRTRREKAAARRAANEILTEGVWRLRFRSFCSVPDGSYCKRRKIML